ncbi:hypothetical protein ACU8KO_002763 [Vibrio alginolyticus]
MIYFKHKDEAFFPNTGKPLIADSVYEHQMVLAKSGTGKSHYWQDRVAEVKGKDPKCSVIDLENNPELKGLKPDAYYLGYLLRESKGKFKLPRAVERRLYRYSLLISSRVHTNWKPR